MTRRSALLVAALGIAALGTLLIILWVKGIEDRAIKDQELVEVLVATEVIEAGETLEEAQSAGKIETREINEIAVVGGALSDTSSISGKVARETIYPDEQIIDVKWGDPGTEQNLGLDEGDMAISVELADPDRVAGFVQPGSEIALFATCMECKLLRPGAAGQPQSETPLPSYTRVILPRARVIGIGGTSINARTTTTDEGEATTEEVPTTVLTISVSQDEAEEVILARHGTQITFALLNEDSDSEDERGAFLRQMFPELFRGVL